MKARTQQRRLKGGLTEYTEEIRKKKRHAYKQLKSRFNQVAQAASRNSSEDPLTGSVRD
jgi:hypothetical protein